MLEIIGNYKIHFNLYKEAEVCTVQIISVKDITVRVKCLKFKGPPSVKKTFVLTKINKKKGQTP